MYFWHRLTFLTPESIRIDNVSRENKGLYQCLISSGRNSVQATGELKLGDTYPELIYTFIEQNVSPGPHISLKCSARGSPPPQVI